jgi:hypothetical protein
MYSFFSTYLGNRGIDCGFKIAKFSDQVQKATGLKYTPHLLTHFSQDDLPFSGLDSIDCFENDTQAVTGDVTQDRKIKNKSGCAFGNRTVEKFMQLVGSHFINIAPGSDNKHLTTSFNMYRHF